MKGLLADFMTSKMLKELGFNEDCIAFYEEDGEFKYNNGTQEFGSNWLANNKKNIEYYSAPLLEQVKKWLWMEHRIFTIARPISWSENTYRFESYRDGFGIVCSIDDEHLDSPLTAENEGIKKSVEYLHKLKQLKK